MKRLALLLAAPSLALAAAARLPAQTASVPAQPDALAALHRGFSAPPMNAEPMMRWWWFGPAVTEDELARELRTMKAGGIGGAEIQPVYPLELNDPEAGFHNIHFLSPQFLKMVSFATDTGHQLGMRMSITLGSGWPYGGAWVPVSEASSDLRVVVSPVPQGETSLPIPSIRYGEKLLAAFLAPGTAGRFDPSQSPRLTNFHQGRLILPSGPTSSRVVLFFISSRTGQQVKRAAVGAEGFVLDHFSAQAVQDHLRNVADPLIQAFGTHPPYSVFSDSLEAFGADWTPDFLTEFRARRGYDLTPYLPQLAFGDSPQAANLRYDWGRTLAELIDTNYLAAINTWAAQHHTQFRSQSYGIPAVTLSSNARVDLPEGEGSQWHGPFSFTRWASSASHVYGRPITSSETWTWLHSPPFRATPLDMKAEADTFFLQGINQLMGHGWPYSPPSAGEPGWHFYAAAVFNSHNPWWIVMPRITAYLTRVSWILRQGQPANDVAVLLPEADAQANFRPSLPRPGHARPSPGDSSVSDQMGKLLGPGLLPAILDHGYNFDFIDSEAIDKVGIHDPLLVIPNIERLPLAAYRKIQAYARSGGIVIATGQLPSQAPGLLEAKRDSAAVRQISAELFSSGNKNAEHVANAADLPAALAHHLHPDVALDPVTPEVGFIHRRLPDADIYFLANTGNQPHSFTATFRTRRHGAQFWNPFTGAISPAASSSTLHLTLAPYESRIIVFTDRALPQQPERAASFAPIDLSHNWKLTLDKTGDTETMQTLHSWADNAAGRYYSGTATYERNIQIPAAVAQAGVALLDFGTGTPIERTGLNEPGYRTWYNPPLRDAALVYVNGKLAGSVWHPPYTLNIAPFLHPGSNQLRIVVANTAINELAGRALPDYRLLWMRYGKRFAPQDQNAIRPLPSGILGPLRIVPGQEAVQ